MNGKDCDLAAHFTVVKEVGVVQYGKPIDLVFGIVPKNDYLSSIKSDIEDAENEIVSNPIYIILNLCRVLAYMKYDLVLSKLEGGKWGKVHLPDEYTDLIQSAIDCYSSDRELVMDAYMGHQFARYMKRKIFAE
jgi:streptomycin 3"-adenylyltransferase